MATLYVSNNVSNGYAAGNDVNAGTEKSAPKQSLDAALAVVANGDRVVINDGNYDAATYFNVTKAIELLPENDYATRLKGASGQGRTIAFGSGGTHKVGKLILVGDGVTSILTRSESSAAPVLDIAGTKFVGEGAGATNAISDSLRLGEVRIKNISAEGIIKSNGYIATEAAATAAEKTVEIDGFDFGDDKIRSSGTFTGVKITRAANAAAAMQFTLRNMRGRIVADTSSQVSILNGVVITGVNTVTVEDVSLTLEKEGDSGGSCIGINVRSVAPGAVVENGIVRRCKINFLAPAGSAILCGQDGKSDHSKKIIACDNEIIGKFYSVATPHGLYLGGLDENSAAYRNIIKNIYVGIIHSLNNGTKAFLNVMDGIYGVDLYAKGSGATKRPIFAFNTCIKRNTVGGMRPELGVFATNKQTDGTKNTDTLFAYNRIVEIDAPQKYVDVRAENSATFTGNMYPEEAGTFVDNGAPLDYTGWLEIEGSAKRERATGHDGRLFAGSLCYNAGAGLPGVTDSGEVDRWGSTFPAVPNVGADQAAPGSGSQPNEFSAWVPFTGTMPSLAFAPAAPGKLKEVQAWDKIVGKNEIGGVPQ